jgi:signal transduction histidine kinase
LDTGRQLDRGNGLDRGDELGDGLGRGDGLDKGDGLVLRAHEERLQRLLENLFRNAVEHAGGEATVRVGTLPGGFFVEDDGPGIPPGEREAVLKEGHSSNEEGTGLGLPIVTSIAEAHGWSISVTESEAGGARFELTGVETGSPERAGPEAEGPEAEGPERAGTKTTDTRDNRC